MTINVRRAIVMDTRSFKSFKAKLLNSRTIKIYQGSKDYTLKIKLFSFWTLSLLKYSVIIQLEHWLAFKPSYFTLIPIFFISCTRQTKERILAITQEARNQSHFLEAHNYNYLHNHLTNDKKCNMNIKYTTLA